jgi:sugar O-acyltransferase (sialic acid O-acetyltransferase NeuD family)
VKVGRRLVIFGVGDFGRIARYYLDADSPHEVVAFTASESQLEGDSFMGLPTVPFEEVETRYPPGEFQMFVAVAYSRVNRNRREIFEKAKALGYSMQTYVCSRATTWPDLTIGEGSFVFENNVIQPFVRVGSNTVLWSGNHIGHDSVVGDHVFIASHVVVSGNCRIGDNTFIGVNATLRDGITVGESCVIGAGVVLLKDAPSGSVYKAVGGEPSRITSGELRKI